MLLQTKGIVAPRHAKSSRTRDRTGVPWVGGGILNHQADREVPMLECHMRGTCEFSWVYVGGGVS